MIAIECYYKQTKIRCFEKRCLGYKEKIDLSK